MADRGFDITDSVGFCKAPFYIPFTKGKSLLPEKDVEETKKIANVCIHIEQVIGLVCRKFTMLQSILPVTLVTRITNITCYSIAISKLIVVQIDK